MSAFSRRTMLDPSPVGGAASATAGACTDLPDRPRDRSGLRLRTPWPLTGVGNGRYRIVNPGTGTATAGPAVIRQAPNSSTSNQRTGTAG
jgi:hypothetical protein